jgi:hypothetical protein
MAEACASLQALLKTIYLQDSFWMLALLISVIGLMVVLPGWTWSKRAFSLSVDFFARHK